MNNLQAVVDDLFGVVQDWAQDWMQEAINQRNPFARLTDAASPIVRGIKQGMQNANTLHDELWESVSHINNVPDDASFLEFWIAVAWWRLADVALEEGNAAMGEALDHYNGDFDV